MPASHTAVSRPAYRRDVDGLRAVAVAMVVLYHALPWTLPGGYVGVDVFFVISGYLITGIIASEVDQGRFSLARFYERRARRILPALTVVLLFVVAFALLRLPPIDVKDMAKGLAGTAAFASNFVFWKESDYFGTDAGETPLLHTWSLSVEEQFYLTWPLILAYVRAERRARWIAVLWLVSFAAAIYHVATDPKMAFFWPHARAWELMTGAALVFLPKLRVSSAVANVLSWVALACVVVPGCAYDHGTPFPGLAALPVCVGTALLIALPEERSDLVSRALRSAPCVSVGLLSYSLYLWHWPLLVYGALFLQRALEPLAAVVAIALSGALSWVSYRWIESPFRHGRAGDTRRSTPRVLRVSGALLAAFFLVGVGLFVSRGLPARADAAVLAAQGPMSRRRGPVRRCIVGTGQDAPRAGCLFGSGAPRVVVWGDSHASAIAPGYLARAERTGGSVELYTKHSCAPLLDETTAPNGACARFNENAWRKLSESPPDALVIAGYWAALSFPTRPELAGRLAEQLRELRGTLPTSTRIVLYGPVPEPGFSVPHCRARALFAGRDVDATCPGTSEASYRRRSGPPDDALRAAAQGAGAVEYLLPSRFLCPQEQSCRTVVDAQSAYVDKHHLSPTAAVAVVDALDP